MANISGPRLMALERAEKRLRELEETHAIEPFAAALVQSVGTILALTPYNKWPSIAQAAFVHNARSAPTAAALYKARLPKE